MAMNKDLMKLGRREFLFAASAIGAIAAAATTATAEESVNPDEMKKVAAVDISTLPRVKQKLVAPPFAPEHDQ